jgi:hypothetical protein
MERFAREKGALRCNDLTGVDISNDLERTAAKEAGVYEATCPGLVGFAANLVEELTASR